MIMILITLYRRKQNICDFGPQWAVSTYRKMRNPLNFLLKNKYLYIFSLEQIKMEEIKNASYV